MSRVKEFESILDFSNVPVNEVCLEKSDDNVQLKMQKKIDKYGKVLKRLDNIWHM